MVIIVNSLGMRSRRFGSGDKWEDFVRQHMQGRVAAVERCSSRREITDGKMYQPVGLGSEGGQLS